MSLTETTTDAISALALLSQTPAARPTPFQDAFIKRFRNPRSRTDRILAQKLTRSAIDPVYADEVINWAEGKRATLPVYKSWEGRAKAEFQRVIMNPHYSPMHAESEMIVSLHDYFKEKAQGLQHNTGRKLLVRELGGNAGMAFQKKTAPFLHATSPRFYRNADLTSSAFECAVEARNQFPNITCMPDFVDFDRDLMQAAQFGRRNQKVNTITIQFGIPHLNTEGLLEDRFPIADVINGHINYRRHQERGDIFIGTWDTCTDEDQLNLMYDPKYGNENICKSLLEGISQELKPIISGKFDIDAFEHICKFNREARAFEQKHRLKRDVHFKILDKNYTFEAGTEKGCAQMWRPDIKIHETVYQQSGYEIMDRFTHKNGHTHLYACRAV